MLAALGAGVFLAGLELMITATALPYILADLAGWEQLRHASWIVNAYLVAYVAMMPIAGRLADRFGIVRPLAVSVLAFGVGSAASGAAQTLDTLIAARVLQGLGAGAIVPLATAGASHLYDGHARARALGVIGALTFLGMAAGPFAGAAILGMGDLRPVFASVGVGSGPIVDAFTPTWRWVFYINVPAAALVLVYLWAAGSFRTPRFSSPLRIPAMALFTFGLAGILLVVTWAGATDAPGGLPGQIALGAASTGALLASFAWGRRHRDWLLDPRVYLDPVYGGAIAVSGLTGYALATALIGAAVFVDRVLYGGPPEQRVALGALAAAMAVGALVSGFALRRLGIVPISLLGLALAVGGMGALGITTQDTPLIVLAAILAVFGLGFGLTVSPRSTAAVEALGQEAYGVASAAVTVARMLGMAVGLAALTAFGSGTIETLSRRVQSDAAFRDSILPAALVGRSLNDGLVVDALERWASRQAAGILDGIFLVAAAVTLAALVPVVLMGRRSRIVARTPEGAPGPARAERADEEVVVAL